MEASVKRLCSHHVSGLLQWLSWAVSATSGSVSRLLIAQVRPVHTWHAPHLCARQTPALPSIGPGPGQQGQAYAHQVYQQNHLRGTRVLLPNRQFGKGKCIKGLATPAWFIEMCLPHLCAPKGHWLTIWCHFPSLQRGVYLLALREAMRAALTNSPMMRPPCQDLISLLFLPPVLQDVSVACHSFFPSAVGSVDTEICHSSHGGRVGCHYYSWGGVIHSVSRHQEVYVARCSLSCLYQRGVANEKQQVNMAARTAVALNLSSHQVGGVRSKRDLGDLHSGHLRSMRVNFTRQLGCWHFLSLRSVFKNSKRIPIFCPNQSGGGGWVGSQNSRFGPNVTFFLATPHILSYATYPYTHAFSIAAPLLREINRLSGGKRFTAKQALL